MTNLEILLECLATNNNISATLSDVRVNADANNPSIEFIALEMDMFNIVLFIGTGGKIVEVCDGDSAVFANIAEYQAAHSPASNHKPNRSKPMARSNYLFGRVKTRRMLNSERSCTVSAYEFKRGVTTMRYTEPVSGPVTGPNVRYRIRITLKEGIAL